MKILEHSNNNIEDTSPNKIDISYNSSLSNIINTYHQFKAMHFFCNANIKRPSSLEVVRSE